MMDGGMTEKRPSSAGSISRIRSPRGVERRERVKGAWWLDEVMTEADALTDFVELVKRSM